MFVAFVIVILFIRLGWLTFAIVNPLPTRSAERSILLAVVVVLLIIVDGHIEKLTVCSIGR